jgi:hypothetical protein
MKKSPKNIFDTHLSILEPVLVGAFLDSRADIDAGRRSLATHQRHVRTLTAAENGAAAERGRRLGARRHGRIGADQRVERNEQQEFGNRLRAWAGEGEKSGPMNNRKVDIK